MCSVPFTITSTGYLMAADPQNGALHLFSLPNFVQQPDVPLVDAPYAVAFNSARTMFVSGVYGNIDEYPVPYSTASATTIAFPKGASSIVFDKNDNMFVSEEDNQAIVELKPPYTGAPITTTNPQPLIDLVINSSGDIFGIYGGQIFEVPPPYTTPALLTNTAYPVLTLAVDANDILYAEEGGAPTQMYTPDYSGAPQTVQLVCHGTCDRGGLR